MKTNTKKRIIAIAIPLGVGVASSLITMNAFEAYESFPRAPLSPPAFLFPIVWTILFILMGIASYLVAVSADTENSKNSIKSENYLFFGYKKAFLVLQLSFFCDTIVKLEM